MDFFLVFFPRPNTGLSPLDEEKTDLLHKYSLITPEKAGMLECFNLSATGD